MPNLHPTDAPGMLVMACLFLVLGSITILRPDGVRSFMDRFADTLEEGSWHPYKMPAWAMRVTGGMLIAIAFLFFWVFELIIRQV